MKLQRNSIKLNANTWHLCSALAFSESITVRPMVATDEYILKGKEGATFFLETGDEFVLIKEN